MKTFNRKTLWGKSWLAYVVPLLIGFIFLFLSIRMPSNPDTSIIVRLSITVPEILVWIIASMGAFRFKKYTNPLKHDPDGKGLNQIANALLLLVVYIILLTTAGTIANLFANTPFQSLALFLRNHLPVLIALASVMYLLAGSRQLVKIVGINFWNRRHLLLLGLSALAFFALFGWTFYASQPHLLTVHGVPRFTLPTEVLLFSYVLPHVLLWFIGLKACVNLIIYAAKAPGIIYKSLFKDLYRGILIVFVCIFVAQFLIITSLTITSFGFALGLIYGILILSLFGFWLIHRGAKKLDLLEG